MNDQSQMMSRNYGAWSSLAPDDPMKFQMNHPRQGFIAAAAKRSGWKGKKPKKGMNLNIAAGGGGGGGGVGNIAGGGGGGYKPPTLHELQSQNRMKARRFYPKKKFNNHPNPHPNPNRFAPYAPRNTTSFIIRAKKSGGIASLVSPCPVTPAVLPTPIFSPSREVLVDMAKEEWGVDGYGSMNGLIRLRSSPGRDEEDEEDGGGSSESDVEEHVEVERRLDHDLSRFEMIYPNENGSQMDDQDAHIAQLEEENLTLKERLFLMEREMVDLRMRLQYLETENRAGKNENENKDGTLETLENEDSSNKENNKENENDEMNMGIDSLEKQEKEEEDDEVSENEGAGDVCSEKSACDGD